MCETLLLLGLALAGNRTDDSAVLDNHRVFTRETPIEHGLRFLRTIPYVNRLFRTVGYTRTQWELGRAVVGGAATFEDLQTPAATAAFPAEEQSLPDNVAPALKPNETPVCEPPSTAEVLRALPSSVRLPYVLETYRDEVDIKTEKLVDKLNPPRFYPLIGPAQLHSVHWKCVVTFTETMETNQPFFKVVLKRRRQEVVYLDKDRLYLVTAMNCQPGQPLGGVCHGAPIGRAPDEWRRFFSDDASATSQRVRACWNPQVDTCSDVVNANSRVNVLKGTIYLFDRESNANVTANGRVVVTATNKCGQKVAEWHFDSASLAKLARRDMIGVGYTLCLPLDEGCLAAGEVRLNVAYHVPGGGVCRDESNRITLQRNDIVRAVAIDNGGRVVQAIGVARSMDSEPGRLADVVRANQDIRGLAQVECTLIVAEVSSAKIDALGLSQSEAGRTRVGVSADVVQAALRRLVADGAAKVLAEPRIITLSGRPADFLTGDDTDKVRVTLLPIVQGDAVNMELHAEITTAKTKRAAGLDRKVPAGRTLVMALPDIQRDDKCLIVLVTPTVVSPPEPARKQMTFSEIIALSKQRVADDIIVRQMDLTESVFRLSVEDILHLHAEGVSDTVIRALQERGTPRSSDVTPTRSKL